MRQVPLNAVNFLGFVDGLGGLVDLEFSEQTFLFLSGVVATRWQLKTSCRVIRFSTQLNSRTQQLAGSISFNLYY